MASGDELAKMYSRSVHPLVMETGSEDFPIGVLGTGFLAGYKGEVFFVTTRHSLRPHAPQPILVWANETTPRSIRFESVTFIPIEQDAEDISDVAVVSVDRQSFVDPETGQAEIIWMRPDLQGWPERIGDLLVIGFPEATTTVQPDEIVAGRHLLAAQYVAPWSSEPLMHTGRFVPVPEVALNGISGSPVFGVLRATDGALSAGLCGMVLRAGGQDAKFHFVDRRALIHMFERHIALAAGSS